MGSGREGLPMRFFDFCLPLPSRCVRSCTRPPTLNQTKALPKRGFKTSGTVAQPIGLFQQVQGRAMMLASRLVSRRPLLLAASAPPAAVNVLRHFATSKPPTPLSRHAATQKPAPESAPEAIPPDGVPLTSAPEPTPLDPAGTAPTIPSTSSTSTDISRSTSLAEAYLDISDVVPASSQKEAFGSTTNAKAKGAGSKSSIEKKRANLTRSLVALGGLGLVGSTIYLGREWDDEFEKMKLVGRSDDLQAIKESEATGWEAWWGRGKLRAADMADVSAYLVHGSFLHQLTFNVSTVSQ